LALLSIDGYLLFAESERVNTIKNSLPLPDGLQFVRGFLMGGADIIPGVSGGTVALILGIYQRLVTAISHCDWQLLRLVRQRQWTCAAKHLDFSFLVSLGMGILTGIVCLAGLMHYLLSAQRPYTLAVFFGLILASSVVVGKMIQPTFRIQRIRCLGLVLLGAVGAYWLVGLQQLKIYDSGYYYFCCGAVAICAMILPGISGAYILWLLGAYESVTAMIRVRRVLAFDWTGQELIYLACFVTGCMVGLIGFSKVLRQLLTHARASTMSVLCGLMLGSLRKVWPFQQEISSSHVDLKHRQYEAIFPTVWDSQVTVCLLFAVVALVGVLVLERRFSSSVVQ
jgi:putative membrane protein